MFSVVRMIIACIFLVCSVIVINKKANNKRIFYVVFTFISVALIVGLAFLPFENLFITFDSPEKAFEYYNFGEYDIEVVVEGNDCDFVVGCKNDTDTYSVIPKTAYGWKIGIGSNVKQIVRVFYDGIIVKVFQYKNTDDYFISVFDTAGGESDVSDKYNTKFHPSERYNKAQNKKYVTYYARISDFDLQYSVNVNGEEIALSY